MPDLNALRLAIIGCGKVTETFHLPVAALSDQFKVTVLVDAVLSRARQLAERYDVPVAATAYGDVLGKADAAIVAVPHHLHAGIACDLARNGIHVLVEKPMALTARDCGAMIETAAEAGVVLAVGMVRRFYPASQFVKQVLDAGWLGDVVSFDVREGVVFSWKVASGDMFRRQAGGGGVLADIGSHDLDLLLWWLGEWDHLEYYDDAVGGVEADCELHLRLQSGATGVVELSRTRTLRNTWIIQGTRGTLEVETGFNPLVRLTAGHEEIALAGNVLYGGRGEKHIKEVFGRQLQDWAQAIRGHREPFVPGQAGKRAVELIEACYAARQPLKLPWMFPKTYGVRAGESALP